MSSAASKSKMIIIVGGGLTGLVTALQVLKLRPQAKIVVLERDRELGGLYNSRAFGEAGLFDFGMHVLYESGDKSIDDTWKAAMPASDWHVYSGNEKDITGAYFDGRLQLNSSYVDLRSRPAAERAEMLAGLEKAIAENPSVDFTKSPHAAHYLNARFGAPIVEKVLRPLFENLYGCPLEKLDGFITKLTAMDRVILFDEAKMLELMKIDALRARLAYPDQLTLPPYRTQDIRALYPKKFGMKNYVEAVRKRLEAAGVEIKMGVEKIEFIEAGERVSSVKFETPGAGSRSLDVETVYWTAGPMSLAQMLKVPSEGLSFDKPVGVKLAHFIFEKPTKMNRSYYIYAFDPDLATFRVTDFSKYCPGSKFAGAIDGFRVSVEGWSHRIGVSFDVDRARAELMRMGIVDESNSVKFSAHDDIGGKFPSPTVRNRDSLRELRSRIEAKRPANVASLGVQAEPDSFFFNDVLKDVARKVERFTNDV